MPLRVKPSRQFIDPLFQCLSSYLGRENSCSSKEAAILVRCRVSNSVLGQGVALLT